jgi:hypothetical protein
VSQLADCIVEGFGWDFVIWVKNAFGSFHKRRAECIGFFSVLQGIGKDKGDNSDREYYDHDGTPILF